MADFEKCESRGYPSENLKEVNMKKKCILPNEKQKYAQNCLHLGVNLSHITFLLSLVTVACYNIIVNKTI